MRLIRCVVLVSISLGAFAVACSSKAPATVEEGAGGSDKGPVEQVDPRDLDGDGVLDSLGKTVDANGDGVPDEFDVDGDGKPDGIGIDTDGDGKLDGVGIDTDGDGLIDAVDTNGDGKPEIIGVVEPPSTPGVFSTLVLSLPGDEPTACEYEWTIRTLAYNPKAVTPRRMYQASCNQGPKAKLFTSLSVGKNTAPPEEDPTSGAIVVSNLDDKAGTLVAGDQRQFEECISMHGIAVSADCQTIGVLCRIPSGTAGFDKDVLATHPDADWMTNPYVCGDSGLNDEMWLFEWTNGDIKSEPKKYIVHKSIGSWEYGNDYLRLGNDDKTWGIGIKTTVGGKDGSGCHEGDALLVMDRETLTMTTRGRSWACGAGHTIMNRTAYDKTTGKYASLCSTDWNKDGIGGLGSYYFRMEDGEGQEFYHLNLDSIRNKGGASALLARDKGGFVGLIVGVPDVKEPDTSTDPVVYYPEAPPTQIGLVKWNSKGEQEGEIKWILSNKDNYLSYSTFQEISRGRYLLGWGVMRAVDKTTEPEWNESDRVPWEYWTVEIDEDGNQLSKPKLLDGVGWGELDEMAPLGQGRAGWAYIDNPVLDDTGQPADCNQKSLELSVYTSPTP